MISINCSSLMYIYSVVMDYSSFSKKYQYTTTGVLTSIFS